MTGSTNANTDDLDLDSELFRMTESSDSSSDSDSESEAKILIPRSHWQHPIWVIKGSHEEAAIRGADDEVIAEVERDLLPSSHNLAHYLFNVILLRVEMLEVLKLLVMEMLLRGTSQNLGQKMVRENMPQVLNFELDWCPG